MLLRSRRHRFVVASVLIIDSPLKSLLQWAGVMPVIRAASSRLIRFNGNARCDVAPPLKNSMSRVLSTIDKKHDEAHEQNCSGGALGIFHDGIWEERECE